MFCAFSKLRVVNDNMGQNKEIYQEKEPLFNPIINTRQSGPLLSEVGRRRNYVYIYLAHIVASNDLFNYSTKR